MRCPKCSTETPNEALCCPGCKLPTPKGTNYLKTKGKSLRPDAAKKPKKRSRQKDKKSINPLIAVPVLLFVVILFGAGSYIATTLFQEAQAGDPGSMETILNKVRGLPSSQEGKTIEDYFEDKVEESRDAGRLREAEGWNVRPLDGKQYLVSFTFEEKGNQKHRAEWEVNLASNTIVAKNDLAAKVYNKE
jgi:hypothetical protein